MQIHQSIQEFPKIPYPVVTSGTFDGVHLGHQKILEKIQHMAAANQGESVLLTFWPHPKYVLTPQKKDFKLLTTFNEKAAILESLGIDHLIKIPFTLEFSQTSSQRFVQSILIDIIGTRELVIGYDHRFGKNREGSFAYLKANASLYGFKVTEIPRQDVDHIGVSSTKIRQYILNHEIHLANKLLGRPYSLTGKVVKGQQIGRNIGFPTANIEIAEEYKLIPSNGAYAARVRLQNSWWNGMMNIGVRPTLGLKTKTIEVHVIDFEGDIYDQEITVQLIKQIRPESKFDNLEELRDRLQIDREEALSILDKTNF